MRHPPPFIPPTDVRGRTQPRVLLYILVACWLVLCGGSLYLFMVPRQSNRVRPGAGPVVADCRVAAVVVPLGIRLDEGSVAGLAGILDPADPAEALRAVSRLAGLVPPGTRVRVEWEPADPAGPRRRASVWLPPPGTDPTGPFPYDAARLLGAVLIQEGLVRVCRDTPYLYRDEFLLLEDDARRHRRGLWASD